MKVFLTVGSMLPFDRLVAVVDQWAGQVGGHEVFAQIGSTEYQPKNIVAVSMIGPAEYRQRFEWCDLVVSHVGMGTVITAAEVGRPVLLLARQVALAEVSSNHQHATAQWLKGKPGIRIASDEKDLLRLIDSTAELDAPLPMGAAASSLIDALRAVANEAMGES